MSQRFRRSLSLFGALALLAMMPTTSEAQAQYDHKHRKRTASYAATRGEAPVVYRGLTVNRAPDAALGDDLDGADIYRDGPTRYNSIRDFSPAPYVTSGQQFPYGLDGIGGFGSDLGFGGGQDAALYDRGAATR